MAKENNVLLSEFIWKLKRTASNMGGGDKLVKTQTLIAMLEHKLEEQGDFEFNLDKMLKHFGF